MTRAYYSISSGPHGIKRCPFCKPKSNEIATLPRGTKLGSAVDNGHLRFRETENSGLEGCLNEPLLPRISLMMPQFRSLIREIRKPKMAPEQPTA